MAIVEVPPPSNPRSSNRRRLNPNREKQSLVQELGIQAVRFGKGAQAAPLLIPIFHHCYIPCQPSLARNPIFFVDETRVFCYGSDLSDFFDHRESLDSGEVHPTGSRWVEFWSDAVVDRRRRNSNSSASDSNSPER
ncbi:hypothetical protein LINPERHAP1_LOCUS22572 [Linum perenne]